MRQSDTTGTLDNVVRRHFKYKQAITQKIHFPCDIAWGEDGRKCVSFVVEKSSHSCFHAKKPCFHRLSTLLNLC